MLSIESFYTATGSGFSVAGATEGGSTVRGPVENGGIGGSVLRAEVDRGDGVECVGLTIDPKERIPPPSPPPALLHRFTLIKPGAKRAGAGIGTGGPSLSPGPFVSGASPDVSTSLGNQKTTVANSNSGTAPAAAPVWSPFDFFFSSGLLVARCDLCSKRLGWKPVLECDDCGLR